MSTSSGWMWANPNERIPGVSITQPLPCPDSAMCRGVPSLADLGDLGKGPTRFWHKATDQSRLADAGVTKQHGGFADDDEEEEEEEEEEEKCCATADIGAS
jgi:hypothetical protein